ncbi:Protein of unknown function (DUF2000) [Pleurocapsa sp. PCC 7327]|uniref:DUF2000 domain-containing protein n=1 Tax=Pleurocapsa sp. PCC 7327 TaxID=118163 RepID=UPI00029FBCD1|nr:DUF2000 domain-containing protein [Pleurocapsa sp. PCC 7327]AFY78291.1 Protein of unknown function (DUF2000) [Pleurocapsa sp. PCC 7327]
MYTNNESKFVAVLNPKIETPKLMNALGHIAAGLVAKADNLDEMKFLRYKFKADWSAPTALSFYPFIILKAKNSHQLKTLHQAANEKGILHNVFTDSMLAHSAIDQMEQTKITNPEDLTYFGVVLFGNSEQLATLTRKFSLFNV